MRFGVSIPPFTDPAVVVAVAVDAERSGWDGVFLWDHLRWNGEVDVHDPWVLLGAIAQVTERLRIGTMITPLSRRRPWVVAKHLTTLDHLSGGRVNLGVGLGEPPVNDFASFGDQADPYARAATLDEALEVLAGLVGDGDCRHRGPRFTVEARLRPRPVQSPRIPIWVAGVAPHRRPLARARRWDGFIPIADEHLTPDELAAYVGERETPSWDVVAQWRHGVPAEEFADAGATWLIESTWPFDDWVEELAARVRAGPDGGS
jgi:alkanesulfonate monooxygenase SsuD/methylene tetrahydromethanopterin reductase-like flavin-dependent oxidoreductase (luciferase family)